MSLQKIKYVISFILILWLHSASSEAQVTVEAKLDSAGIFIGQRIGLTLEVTSDAGKEVTLAGWVQRTRKMGGMTFVDLRDRYGITQLVFNEAVNAELNERANRLGREFVIQVKGTVR